MSELVSQTRAYYDGVAVAWTAVEGATSYKVVVNGTPVGTTTDLAYETRGYSDGESLAIVVQSSADDVAYTDAPDRSTTFTVANTATSTSTLPNWSGIGHCFLDPFNPTEIVICDTHYFKIYNTVTNTVTDLHVEGGIPNVNFVRRNNATKEFYCCSHNWGHIVFRLGKNLERFDLETPGWVSEENQVFTAPSYIRGMDVSFDGTTIYYGTEDNEIRSVGTDGSNDRLILETTENPGMVATDPCNSATLVYVDGTDIKYHDLVSGVTTDVLVGSRPFKIAVLNGTLYAQFYGKVGLGYTRMNLDGSNVYTYADRIYARNLVIDTVNKMVYTVKLDGIAYIHVDGNIADLPDAPGLVSVVPRPMSIDLEWPVVSGATSYGVKYFAGAADVGEKTTSVASTTKLTHSVKNLLPNTLYSVYSYYSLDDTDPAVPMSSGQYMTLLNVASNHDVSLYADERGGFDLRELSTRSLGALDDVMNDIFSTGDSVTFSLRGKRKTKSKFVKRGDTAAIEMDVSIAMPFSASGGSGQSVTLALTDETTTAVAYDDTTEEISIGGTTYVVGDSLVLDDQKVTIFSV